MNKDKYLTRFILVGLISEVTAQRLLTTNKLMLREAMYNVKKMVETPVDNLVTELIENLRDMELDRHFELEEEFDVEDLTTDSEWFEKICDLVDGVRKDVK